MCPTSAQPVRREEEEVEEVLLEAHAFVIK